MIIDRRFICRPNPLYNRTMIRHTFVHIPGIGPKTEQNFWAAGVLDWDAFDGDVPLKLSTPKRNAVAVALAE